MFVAEIAVDAIKHAFIAKYNSIKAEVYDKFKLNLCKDMTNSRHHAEVSVNDFICS